MKVLEIRSDGDFAGVLSVCKRFFNFFNFDKLLLEELTTFGVFVSSEVIVWSF